MGIVKVTSDAILMRSVFCFETFQRPPRLVFGMGENPKNSLLVVLPAFFLRGNLDRLRQIGHCRLLDALGDHSLVYDISEQEALSFGARPTSTKILKIIDRKTVSSRHGYSFY